MADEIPGFNPEQDPKRIKAIRDALRDIYGMHEIAEAVIEHYMGRIDDFSAEAFRRMGEVTIKKGFFAFNFYPRVRRDPEAEYSDLSIGRTPLLINKAMIQHPVLSRYTSGLPVNSYTLDGRIDINATDPNLIKVWKRSDWLSDEKRIRSLKGGEALDLAEEVIDSFIHPEEQVPQIPQV